MASSPVAAEWMARWIKWVERDGHDPVLWLRDYRIDDAETRRVVDALRGLAREQGISLERIVVNGREFWRNPDHEPNRSKE
jgi:predicted O-linked N-acetylglucosamine transferase (SPINDLY family)